MKQRKDGRKVYCRDWRRWWHGSWFGIFLIIIGGLWLGAELGLFNSTLFWPLAFIGVGTWIIISSLLGGKSGKRSR